MAGGVFVFMEVNQRILAARQFIMNQVKKSPLVQAVQQKSFKPYKKALSNTLEPGNLMPMGRLGKLRMPSQKVMQRSVDEFENDAAQHRAIGHLNSSQATANRIKQFQAQKTRELMVRAFSGFIQRSKNMSNFQNNL